MFSNMGWSRQSSSRPHTHAWALLPATMILLLAVPAVYGQVVFTGNAAADFAGIPGVIVKHDATNDVGLPGSAPPGTVSGWNMQALYLFYNPRTDVMHVGVDCVGICGDADGDGNPGGTAPYLLSEGGVDLPNYGGTEFFALVIDTNNNGVFDSGGPDVVIGIPATSDYFGFTAATFTGSPFAPGFAFSATLPNAVSPFASPSAAQPDLEFTIANFSTLPGFSFRPGSAFSFGANAAQGSLGDDGIGEDFVPAQATLEPVPIPATLDFGDAPDPTFPTLLASNGARHVLGSNVYLGACVDSELNGQPAAGASGDDTGVGTYTFGTCAVLGHDEDGVSFTSSLFVGANATMTVTANAACTLSAFIDFNRNGDWADAGETLFPGGRALVPGANSLSFTVPSVAAAGLANARFRCTAAGPVSYTGLAADGEVEDYQVTIQLSYDLGDAPDPTFPTLLASNGARHVLGSNVYLGACVDAESNGQAVGANGDDRATGNPVFGTCAVAGDDEDGVIFATPLYIGAGARLTVTANASCMLSGFIDFNRDGDWVDTGEPLFPSGQALAPGSNTVNFTVPPGASAGTAYARFRCTTDGPVSFSGLASNGEVEDYQVTIEQSFDLGDAPDPTHPTLRASNGAVHALGSGIFLGSCVDAESNGQGNAGANGDDLNAASPVFGTCAAGGVDEDGVRFTSALVLGNPSGIDVTASAPCILSAFIDFNRNGTWADAGESLFPGGRPLAVGTSHLTFPVPSGAALGATYARFRCTTDGPVTYIGTASNGEIEDYTVTIQEGTPNVRATKSVTAVDKNSNSRVDPGEQLNYTITVGNSGTADAAGVVLSDTPDPNTVLMVGSVTTSAGTVTSGNMPGQTSVGVNIGTVAAAGGTVTITFSVTIKNPLSPGVTQVSNQGQITGGNIPPLLTDDPAPPGDKDPTVTPVPPSVAIPALDEWGFLAMLLLLGWFGIRALSRT